MQAKQRPAPPTDYDPVPEWTEEDISEAKLGSPWIRERAAADVLRAAARKLREEADRLDAEADRMAPSA